MGKITDMYPLLLFYYITGAFHPKSTALYRIITLFLWGLEIRKWRLYVGAEHQFGALITVDNCIISNVINKRRSIK